MERFELIRELESVDGSAAVASSGVLIDDEERDSYVLKQSLRRLPVLTLEASSGTEGLRGRTKHKPGIIFLDLGMPDLTGFEVLEKLKESPDLAGIQVVIVTSRALTQAERDQLQRRAMAIVGKDKLESTDFAELIRRAHTGKEPASNSCWRTGTM